MPAWPFVPLMLFLSISGFPASAIPRKLTRTPHRFVSWCLNQANLTWATRHTVNVLLEQAKTQNCDLADRRLSTFTNLFLKGDQVIDLAPLSSLTNLTALFLNHNQIADLKPLSSLTNLTDLYLDKNQIRALKTLSYLTNLNSLCISQNQMLTTKTCPVQPEYICHFYSVPSGRIPGGASR